jgi:hypothetical protein
VVWYGDVCFKQWTVIEFLVAEKESVMNIHKQLNMCSVSAVDKSTFSCCTSRFTGSEKGQMKLSDACHSGLSMTAVTWASLWCAGELVQHN